MARELDVEKVKSTAKLLYRLQDFNNNSIQEKTKDCGYSWGSIVKYVGALRLFLKTGTRDLARANNTFYDEWQNCKDTCVSPLTPSSEDRVRNVIRNSSTNVKRGSKVHTYVDESVITSTQTSNSDASLANKPGRVKLSGDVADKLKNSTKHHAVGVMLGDNIRIFDNDDVLKGFMIAINEANLEQTFDIVDVTYTKREK